MLNTEVKYFSSTMNGAPALSNSAGTLIAVLDACLVNGFGSVTLDSLVVASNVATGTVSAGHNFAMVGNTGPVITIAGATPAGLNGEWRIASIPGSTTFTFATTGISDQTATGTITAKRAPAGFSKAFSGTNTAAYRSDNVAGSRLYLQVADSYASATYAMIRGFTGMTAVDTGTEPFPTGAQAAGTYIYKASNTNCPWNLYSDGRMIYFFCDSNKNSSWVGGLVFGELDSYVEADTYNGLLIHAPSSMGALALAALGSTTNSYLCRARNQVTLSVESARYSHRKCPALGTGGPAYEATNLLLWPVEVWDGTTDPRGLMPGLWCPVHNGDTPHGLVVEGILQLPNRTLLVQTTQNTTSECAIDIMGPWR